MKLLIVSAVFPPETVVSSQTSAQLAEGLLADGHTVRVIAPFPNRPGGQLYPGHRRTLLRRSRREDGLHLTHCFTVISGESGMVSRFLENLSFGLSAGLAFLLEPKPDVIYANTWPTFATGILALLARLRGVPLVVSVYQEGAVTQTGQSVACKPFLMAKPLYSPKETGSMYAMQLVFSQGATPYQQQRLDVKRSTLFLLIFGLDNGGHYTLHNIPFVVFRGHYKTRSQHVAFKYDQIHHRPSAKS